MWARQPSRQDSTGTIPAVRVIAFMENERIRKIEEEIADLKARWPAHSVPVSMWQKLEELEEELEKAKAELENKK